MSETVIARILLGESIAIQRVRALIARVATCDLPVMVQGDTGTGKELVAQALHVASGRSGCFVPFNVCAIGESMFEDALFGHVRGAFTGAAGDVPGYLAEAHRGTVFLDEIGGMPIAAQAKLLRAIETREFRPVGARRDARSDFRVVAASNVSLVELVESGAFRRDLARRLRAVTIDLPPLRERLADVPVLVMSFVAAMNAIDGEATVVEPDAMELLKTHSWPDNVRELRQVVECALALAVHPNRLDRMTVVAALQLVAGDPRTRATDDLNERVELTRLLEECGGRIGRAAFLLGVHRTTLFRRMRRLGVAGPRAKKEVFVEIPVFLADVACDCETRQQRSAAQATNVSRPRA